jgi:hypothetical protein
MITGVYRFLSNVSRSSVNVSTTTIKSNVAEANTCTIRLLQHYDIQCA